MKTSILVLLSFPLLVPSIASARQTDHFIPDTPPVELWGSTRDATVTWRSPSSLQRGDVFFFTAQKQVQVHWFAAAQWSIDGVAESPHSEKFASYATSYFPTEVTVLNDHTLLVAGKYSGTETVIEKWVFWWRRQFPLPISPVGGGQPIVEVTMPYLALRKEVYRDDIAGQRLVSKMTRMRHNGTSALVHFFDQGNVHLLDLTTDTLSLVASPAGGTPLGQVPGLTDAHDFMWSGDHLLLGYIYVFGTHSLPWRIVDRADTLVLIDSNRDGVLDTVDSVTDADWSNSTYANGHNYISRD